MTSKEYKQRRRRSKVNINKLPLTRRRRYKFHRIAELNNLAMVGH